MKIGIIGNGFVGKATKLLACFEISLIVFDIRPEFCEPLGTTLEEINKCDLVFFCLLNILLEPCHGAILKDDIHHLHLLTRHFLLK